MRRWLIRRWWFAAGVGVALLATGWTAGADGGDPTLIHACVATDGAVRIVAPSAACHKHEAPRHWSIAGPPGPPGVFSGQFVSPNGLYSIAITNEGIVLSGPGGSIQIDAADVVVLATRNAEIASGAHTSVSSDGQTNIISGGATNLAGAVVTLNGPGCPPVARAGDPVEVFRNELNVMEGVIVGGSPTVTSC